MLRCVLALGLAASLLWLVACGGSQPSPVPAPSGTSSGVRGIVLFSGGPAIISPRPLPDGFGDDTQGRPYRDVIVEVKASTGLRAGQVVAKVKPGAQALFSIALPPSTYVLTTLVPKNGPWPRPTTVVVKPGQYTRAIVYVEGM